MASLTSFLPRIAPTLRTTTPTLYERQRALVRMKLLPTPKGRGRGSGAEANPGTIALLLISVLASDSLSEIDGPAQALSRAAYVPVGKGDASSCRYTGKSTFSEALACVIADDRLAKFRPSITVSRDTLGAAIYWYRSRRADVSYFGSPPEVMSNYIEREVRLHYRALLTIKNELRAVLPATGDQE